MTRVWRDPQAGLRSCHRRVQQGYPAQAEISGAYNNRGVSYAHKRDWDKSIADYNEAIRLNPEYVEAYYNRGITYNNKGDWDKSIADYNEAIRLNPDYAEAYDHLAWLLAVCPDANIRNGAKAVEYAKRACELSDKEPG